MKVSKWGNSLAVRLPSAVVEALELKDGDDVDLRLEGDLSFRATKRLSRAEALQRLKKFRGLLPPGFKFSRDEANER